MPVPPRWPARCGLVRRRSEEQEEAAGAQEEEEEEERGVEQAGREEGQPGSAPSGAGTDRAPLPAGGPRPPSPGSDGERETEGGMGGGMERGREVRRTAGDRSPAVLLQQETHHLLPLWAGRGGSEDPRAQLNVLWLRALILKVTKNM